MSFGFGIGDFVAVSELCWKLYRNVYSVSRDAPEELRNIRDELGGLSNTIHLLNDDMNDPQSVLRQSGQENRAQLAISIMKDTNNTLLRLEKISNKYDILQAQGAGSSRRQFLRIQWHKLRFAKELDTINDLRGKLMYHNNLLTLLLQVVNNSSLERLQKEEQRTQNLIEDVRSAMYGRPNLGSQPIKAPFLAERTVEMLTETMLRNAQAGTRPWASIGIDSWIQTGKWWLMKAQASLYTSPSGSPEFNQAFIDLLKSSWILTDIISMHPQRNLIVSTDSRDRLIEQLAQAIRREHSKLNDTALPEPSLSELQCQDLSIWNAISFTALLPARPRSSGSSRRLWKTEDGDLLFQSFGGCIPNSSGIEVECILIIEVKSNDKNVVLIAQGFDGRDIIRTPLYDGGKSSFERVSRETNTVSLIYDAGRHERLVLTNDQTGVTLYSLCCGIEFLSVAFEYPTIDIRSLESAGLLWCMYHQDFDAFEALRKFRSASSTPTNNTISPSHDLEKFVSSAVERILELRRLGNPKVWPQSPKSVWPTLVWLSPAVRGIFSLAESMDSFAKLYENRFQCIQVAFLRGDSTFFSSLLEHFDIPGSWIEGIDSHPPKEEGSLGEVTSLISSVIRSGNEVLLDSLLKHMDGETLVKSLPNFLMEACENRNRVFSKTILKNCTREGIFKETEYWLRVRACLKKFLHTRPGHTVENLLESVPIDHAAYLAGKVKHPVEPWFGFEENKWHDFHLPKQLLSVTVLRNTEPESGRELWVIPAILRQDHELLRYFLSRQVVTLDLCDLIMPYKSEGATHHGPYHERIPLEGEVPPADMPHYPLYLAILLASEPSFIRLLCESGAVIERGSKGESGTQTDPAIILHLLNLTTLGAARNSFKRALTQIAMIVLPTRKYWKLDSHDTWERNPRSSLSRHNELLEIAEVICTHRYQWIIKGPPGHGILTKYDLPSALETQETWDEWRSEVLQILRGRFEKVAAA